MSILPRFIRYRDAPAYLGMDKNRFDNEVRPSLVELPIGQIGVAFDRLDLDAWADDYKSRMGRQSKKQNKGNKAWQKNKQDLQKEATTGTSTKSSKVTDFTKALERVTLKKPNAT